MQRIVPDLCVMISLALKMIDIDWPPRVSRSELYSFFTTQIDLSAKSRDAVPKLIKKNLREEVPFERAIVIFSFEIGETSLNSRAGLIFRDDCVHVAPISNIPLFLTDTFV